MSCHEADEVDLPGFLAEPDAPGFQEFRDHYPRCSDCAAEVRAFARLEYALLDGVPAALPSHPGAERLATWVEAPGALRASDRLQIERHVEACPGCRDEVAAIRSLRPAPAPPPLGRPRPGRARGALEAARGAAEGLLHRAGAARTALWALAGALAMAGLYLGSGESEAGLAGSGAVVAAARPAPGPADSAAPDPADPPAAAPLEPESPARIP